MVKKTVKKAKPVAGKGRQTKGKGKAVGATKPEVVSPEVVSPEVEVKEVELAPEIPPQVDETYDPTPVSDEEAQATLDADKEDKEPKEEKPVKESKSKAGEWWWNDTGEVLVRRGHGQRNIVLKAGREAGISPSEAIARFQAFDGAFRERILSLFE